MDPLDDLVEAPPTLLERAAEKYGVETTFFDIFGEKHLASDDVLQAVLRSLGVDASSDEALQLALQGGEAAQPVLPPTFVLTRRDRKIPLPAVSTSGLVRAGIQLEDGSEIMLHELELPPDIPFGYHQLRLAFADGSTVSANLIVCPDRAYQPPWLEQGKAAGIAISLYGVRSARNWGCGDTTDLARLIDWTADDLNASFVALNPLHAIPNRQPYNTSPYLPNSTFYRNHIYLDIEAIEDFPPCERARRLLASASVQTELMDLRAAAYVQYERVSGLKLVFLKALFRRFLQHERAHDTPRSRAFQAYVEREGRLLDLFAVHSALDESLHRAHPDIWNWPAWPPEFQDPESPQTREFASRNWRSVLFHKYVQWQLDLQFAQAQAYALERGLKIGLYHDLALATDRFGSDLWAHRPFYAGGCRVGSPPDNFSPKGQDWSFPPPNSERHRRDGYRLFAESIRKASAHGGALRIDHVMRFFRLYWIPGGKDATEGTYVKDHYLDLVRVLALESVRGRFVVIGEDLGTVPDIARTTLKEYRILSYRLLYFEQDRAGRFRPPEEYPRQALAAPTTHDLPTLAGFWECADIEARRAVGIVTSEESFQAALEDRAAQKRKLLDLLQALGLLPGWFPRDARLAPELAGELHSALIGFLALTPSQLLGLNQEDLFKDREQQNLPGTTAEHPNWRHKMKFSVEDLRGDLARGYNAMFRSWLERTGRANHMK